MVRSAARRTIAAAVDIGAYSVHLLVAEVGAHDLRTIHDESAFLGLGAKLGAGGRLGVARETLRETLAGFVAHAATLGAETVTIVGTDPLRRASDRDYAIEEIRSALGIDVVVLSKEQEAMLAVIGGHGGRPVPEKQIVIDVGGGSTEIVLARPGTAWSAVGLPLGAARLTTIHVTHDPPTADEMARLRGDVVEAMRRAPDDTASRLVAVGGTARSLLRVGRPPTNRILSARRIRKVLDVLVDSPSAEVAERYGIRLSRARVLPAGATILSVALERYRLDRLSVAVGGLREGTILVAHRAGPGWLEHLPRLARGWSG